MWLQDWLLSCFCSWAVVIKWLRFTRKNQRPKFYAEKKICEKKARDYAVEMREDWSASDEISHVRRCMQENGWNYRFRN